MIDVNELVEDVTGSLDQITENQQTKRQQIDATSQFMLPHLIRPIISLIVLFMQILIFVAVFFKVEVPDDLIYEVGALNMATIGFYFNSRRNEKINAKKTEAAIKIESIRAKAEVKEERRDNRQGRRQERRDERNS